MLDETFYTSLLTFSAIGFTVFISGGVARYTILRNIPIEKWFFKIFVIILVSIMIPGVLLAISPILILYAFLIGNMNCALYGFYVVFVAYLSAALIMTMGFIIGYGYLYIENHFLRVFQNRLKEQKVIDYPSPFSTYSDAMSR